MLRAGHGYEGQEEGRWDGRWQGTSARESGRGGEVGIRELDWVATGVEGKGRRTVRLVSSSGGKW